MRSSTWILLHSMYVISMVFPTHQAFGQQELRFHGIDVHRIPQTSRIVPQDDGQHYWACDDQGGTRMQVRLLNKRGEQVGDELDLETEVTVLPTGLWAQLMHDPFVPGPGISWTFVSQGSRIWFYSFRRKGVFVANEDNQSVSARDFYRDRLIYGVIPFDHGTKAYVFSEIGPYRTSVDVVDESGRELATIANPYFGSPLTSNLQGKLWTSGESTNLLGGLVDSFREGITNAPQMKVAFYQTQFEEEKISVGAPVFDGVFPQFSIAEDDGSAWISDWTAAKSILFLGADGTHKKIEHPALNSHYAIFPAFDGKHIAALCGKAGELYVFDRTLSEQELVATKPHSSEGVLAIAPLSSERFGIVLEDGIQVFDLASGKIEQVKSDEPISLHEGISSLVCDSAHSSLGDTGPHSHFVQQPNKVAEYFWVCVNSSIRRRAEVFCIHLDSYQVINRLSLKARIARMKTVGDASRAVLAAEGSGVFVVDANLPGETVPTSLRMVEIYEMQTGNQPDELILNGMTESYIVRFFDAEAEPVEEVKDEARTNDETFLNVAGVSLDRYSEKGNSITVDRRFLNAPWKYHVDVPYSDEDAHRLGRVRIEVVDADGNRIGYARQGISEDEVRITWESTPELNSNHRISLEYSDEYSGRRVYQWSNVEFVAPLINRTWFRTIIAFLVIASAIVVTVKLGSGVRFTTLWMPSLYWLVGVAASSYSSFIEWANLDGTLLMWMLIATALVCLPVGMMSPRFFRALAQVAPFHWLCAAALTLRPIRARLFRAYGIELKAKVDHSRRAANRERYVAVPAVVKKQELAAEVCTQPAARIVELLSAPAASNVVIVSPGGRGKTALLRQVICELLERWNNNASCPLPILCDRLGDSVEESVRMSLGRHYVSDEALEAQLLAGDFVLVFDGISETGPSPEAFSEFLRGRFGTAAKLLVSQRPRHEFEFLFDSFEQTAFANPLCLDDETIENFEQAYFEDEQTPGQSLTDEVRLACRSREGTYLPILIRLAILAGGNAKSIPEIYNAAFYALVVRSVPDARERDLLRETSQLCLQNYWVNEYQTIPLPSLAPNQRALVEQLLQAGVLVELESVPQLGARAGRVGSLGEVDFFHDSMRSYLTAMGLSAEEKWDALKRAAADEPFRSAKADFLIEDVSELFQMCLFVFRPVGQLRATLVAGLEDWVEQNGRYLSRRHLDWVLPDEIGQQLDLAIDSLPPPDALSKAIELAAEEQDHAVIADLGHIYARAHSLDFAVATRELSELIGST